MLVRVASVTAGWILLAAAYVLATWIVADPILLPSLASVVRALAALVGDPPVWGHLAATLRETGAAVTIAIVVGVPVGLLVGSSERVRRSLEAPIDWLRSIPATALFPVTLLFFGLGAQSRIAIATYGSLFPVIVSTLYGASAVDRDRLRHARRCGLRVGGRLVHVISWDALPSVLAGIRLAISASLVLIVVGEMFIGAQRGVGYLVVFHQNRYQTPEMLAVIALVGFVGYALNRGFLNLERRASTVRGHGGGPR